MKNKIKYLIIIFITVILPINVIAISSVDEQREALIETALAYYRKRTKVQYDSFRKNLYSTPEDATSQHPIYTVCSGFVFSVYKHTLDIEIPKMTGNLLNYAKENKNEENIIFYYGSSNEISSVDVLGDGNDKFIEKWIDIVRPGDIFVYQKQNGEGHAMLVRSIDLTNKKITLIESGGTNYNIENHVEHFDDNGSIGSIGNIEMRRRLDATYTKMALIRIVTDGQNYINKDNQKDTYNGLTDSAKSRLKYKNIDIEKTVEISNSSSPIFANIGDEITYKITITNNSNSNYSNLNVIENIDSRLLVSNKGSGTLDGNKLKWNIQSIEPSKKITISYTVVIPNDKSLLGKFILSTGKVDNISTSKTEILIGNKLTKNQQQKLLDSFNNLKSNSQIEREFINQIYKNALNVDLGLNKLNNLDIISYDNSNPTSGENTLSIKYTKLNNTILKKYVYSNFYGLRLANTNNVANNIADIWTQWNFTPSLESNDRARTITSDMLLNGDIILVYGEDSTSNSTNLVNKSYLYLNNILYRKIGTNNFKEITGDNLTIFLRNLIGHNYIILRPSLAILSEEPTDKPVDDPTEEPTDKPVDDPTEEPTDKPVDDPTEEPIKNPQTGYTFKYSILIITILMSGLLYLVLRKKSMFKKHN